MIHRMQAPTTLPIPLHTNPEQVSSDILVELLQLNETTALNATSHNTEQKQHQTLSSCLTEIGMRQQTFFIVTKRQCCVLLN